MRWRAVGALLFFIVACAPAAQQALHAPEQDPAPEGLIVALGDSLTSGAYINASEAYPAHLQRLLEERGYRYTVRNEGVSGETSAGTLARVDEVIALDPDVVILEIGANDALRGRGRNETKRDIAAIVDHLQGAGITVVLAGMHVQEPLGSAYLDDFKMIYPELAQEKGIAMVPFFLDGVFGRPEYNTEDGIHPNGEGYALIARENVLPVLEESLARYGSAAGS